MTLPEIRLRVRVRGRHPWFYKRMVRRPAQRIPPGAAVSVRDREGAPLGTGFYNPRSEIAVRLLGSGEVDDPTGLLVRRLDEAHALREEVLRLPESTDAYRLVHAEGDGIPGLVLDRLGRTVVAQVGSLGTYERLEALGERLLARRPDTRLVLTVDRDAARREGIERPPPPDPRHERVREHGLVYHVAPGAGHKTGFFADQRDHRLRVRGLARGRRVLDLCCNSGGFALNAARGGARRVRAVDLDEEVLAQAAANAETNRLGVETVHEDAFDHLRAQRPGAWDLMVLDPPKWVAHRRGLGEGLARYRDLNGLALAALAPGGLLVTASCSGPVEEPVFLRTLAEAAARAGRDVRVLHVGGAGADHPVALECPETRYLVVATLQVR